MHMNLQRLIRSSFGVKAVSVIARILPVSIGHKLADRITTNLSHQKDSEMNLAIHSNQWVIRDCLISKEDLDRAVSRMLVNSGHFIFDQYHYLNNDKSLQRLILYDKATLQLIKRAEFERKGLMIAGIHLGNFDLVLHTMCRNGLKPLILTLPVFKGSHRTEYEIRRKSGMNLVPTSIDSLRLAVEHLKQGGSVLTGIDRPIPDARTKPLFFGLPSNLPQHYAYIAKKANVPVVLMATLQQPDGRLLVRTSDPIEMDSHPNKESETLLNSEKVLKTAEPLIRQVPDQWSISLPVWPEMVNLYPK